MLRKKNGRWHVQFVEEADDLSAAADRQLMYSIRTVQWKKTGAAR
jgi:hypothetical protein